MPTKEIHFFSNALNTTIHGGTFAAAQGDIHMTTFQSIRQGLIILLGEIARGAFHNASERSDPPRCHPRTRKVILNEIMHWIISGKPRRHFILWLHGPAGSGKSAIAQSIAESCERKGLLAASFFFSQNVAGRNNTSHIIATLAYQLSIFLPAMTDHLCNAIEKDPAIFSRALSTQMRRLLIEPLKMIEVPGQPLVQHAAFVVIDAVEECGDDRAHTHLLDALGTLASESQHIPLVFLVVSRPEYAIRQELNEGPFEHLIERLVLDESHNPDKDIRTYLEHVFSDIRRKYSSLGEFPTPWPTEEELSALVKKASGQFLFAATAARFVDNPRHNPTKRLPIILGLSGPGKDMPFAALDALYHFILSSAVNVEEVLQVLTLLTLSKSSDLEKLDIKTAEELLGFEIRRALVDMHALIYVPPPKRNKLTDLRIHHASMYDFLLDPLRSGRFSIDAAKGHTKLTIYWLKMLNSYTGSVLVRNHPLVLSMNTLFYHCMESPISSDIAEELATFDLTTILEQIEFGSIPPVTWNNFLLCIQRQDPNVSENLFPRIQAQFDSYIQSCLFQYPETLRSCIPAIMALMDSSNEAPGYIFYILLHAGIPSLSDIRQLQTLDRHLLRLSEVVHCKDSWFQGFFNDSNRAGASCWADETSYANLAKQLLRVIYPGNFEERKPFCQIYPSIYPSNPSTVLATITEYLTKVLTMAILDSQLITLIYNCALQYKKQDRQELLDGQNKVALAGLAYLNKFGQPFKNHAHHWPERDACIICETCCDAFVIEVASELSDHSPSLTSNPTPSTRSRQRKMTARKRNPEILHSHDTRLRYRKLKIELIKKT